MVCLGSLDHCPRGSDFGLADGTAGFDVQDHGIVGIDQIIGGIGKEGMSFMGSCPLRGWIGGRDELRRYPPRPRQRRHHPASPDIPDRACGILVAWRSPVIAGNGALLVRIGGDQAGVDGKPSPPTKPSDMHRLTTVSNR